MRVEYLSHDSSIRIILYTSKTLNDGTHPIMLYLNKNGRRKKIALGLRCKKEHWDNGHSLVNPSCPRYEQINKKIYRAKIKAENILFHFEDIDKDFSFKEFEIKYKGINSGDVFDFFKLIIDRLEKTGKVGNAEIYKSTRNKLKKFHSKETLNFNEINYRFLKGFEEQSRLDGNIDNTISLHMRTLRALFNKAIKEEICNPTLYPFKTYEVGKLKNETSKLAITKEEIGLIK